MSQLKEHQNSQDILNYMVIDIIGTGSFGTCYKVKDKTTNKHYVWKAVDYGSMSLHEKELLVTEVNLMGTLKHPYIVQYFGRIVHKSSGTLYIIMEWCEGGDLDTLINKCKSKNLIISEKFVWKVLYQTAKALEACHSLLNQVTVLHRDIKPANIFLDRNYNVKLGDFGLAKILQNNVNFSSTLVGTPYYMSPEQIHGSKYNKKTDVWSLGCLVYELCCLNQPFNGTNLPELRDNITKNRLSRIPSMYSEYLDKMVKLLLSSNHEFRPSVEMIVHHPTVICNYEASATPFQPDNSHSGSGDAVYQLATLPRHTHRFARATEDNIDGIIKRIEKLSAKPKHMFVDSDPKAITEDVYNRKLMSRLKLLREKESVLRAKEDSLKTKEYLLKTKESTLEHKRKQIEKREREIVALQQNSTKHEWNRLQMKSVEKTKEIRKSLYVDLDSTTCSADPGDLSVAPTAVKLDPAKIIRPSCFTVRKLTKNSLDTCGTEEMQENAKNAESQSRQPLTFLQNYVYSSTSKSKNAVFVRKYQNFIYKR